MRREAVNLDISLLIFAIFSLCPTMASSSTAFSDDLIAPYEIVFSCSLCQKTITDLYTKSHSNKSPNDVPDSLETETTKLWMTECGHVTCGEHFEGGGECKPVLWSRHSPLTIHRCSFSSSRRTAEGSMSGVCEREGRPYSYKAFWNRELSTWRA